jgi:dienelactone hydrolase
MPRAAATLTTALLFGALLTADVGSAQFRTLNDRYAPPRFTSLDDWKPRAAYLREHILASAGLLPSPEKTPLNPVVFDEIDHKDYTVSKVYFESLPGFLVTGNLYRPIGDGPFPAVLSPHGHWAYGRLENTDLNSGPGRAINLARQGFVVFTYDMVGYNDSQQLPHRTFSGTREYLWSLSVGGLQLWDSIRSLDFLESLPYVKRDAIGVTGESGGGTQTFLLAAVDDRVAVAVPVNMISLHMQGGCICENPPGLRLDTNNVEIAATIAPRPLLMVSATGDWTNETMALEYPAVRAIYGLFGAADHVKAVQFKAEHNYNKDSREAMYAWMARWLQHQPADVVREEKAFTPDAPPDLLVFHHRALPSNAVTREQLTANWIDAARQQLTATPLAVRAAALRHALGYGDSRPPGASAPASASASARARASAQPTTHTHARTVLLAGDDAVVARGLRARAFTVQPIAFTPFDAEAAAKIDHFDTYNRTAAGARVADIVNAVREHPGAALVASGDAAAAALLAAAVVPVPVAVVDLGGVERTDAWFADHFYIPGLRRAGDFQTAIDAAAGTLVLHNVRPGLGITAANLHAKQLSPQEIAEAIRAKLVR